MLWTTKILGGVIWEIGEICSISNEKNHLMKGSWIGNRNRINTFYSGEATDARNQNKCILRKFHVFSSQSLAKKGEKKRRMIWYNAYLIVAPIQKSSFFSFSSWTWTRCRFSLALRSPWLASKLIAIAPVNLMRRHQVYIFFDILVNGNIHWVINAYRVQQVEAGNCNQLGEKGNRTMPNKERKQHDKYAYISNWIIFI